MSSTVTLWQVHKVVYNHISDACRRPSLANCQTHCCVIPGLYGSLAISVNVSYSWDFVSTFSIKLSAGVQVKCLKPSELSGLVTLTWQSSRYLHCYKLYTKEMELFEYNSEKYYSMKFWKQPKTIPTAKLWAQCHCFHSNINSKSTKTERIATLIKSCWVQSLSHNKRCAAVIDHLHVTLLAVEWKLRT